MQRSNTTSKTSFCLPDEDGQPAAIFDFIEGSDSFRVTIPSKSDWRYWYHWQSRDASLCDAVSCLDGAIVIVINHPPPLGGATTMGGKGTSKSLESDVKWSWYHMLFKPNKRDDLVVNLTGDEDFHRNVCSAILDRERMAFLASTPMLLRLLLSLLARIAPSKREWVLDMMLAIQLRMIFYAHGFWMQHWTISILWWWQWRQIWGWPRPPAWAYKVDWQLQKATAYAIQALCYWAGFLLLGMKGRYPEYTPDPRKGEYRSPADNGNDEKIPLGMAEELL